MLYPDSSSTILERFRRGRGKDIDLTIRQPYLDLLKRLGNPHLKLPPVFHVAGTNGKGSTCAFLRSMTEASGRKAHVYTSPHLVSFHERIRIAGNLIDEAELVEILKDCERLSESSSISYFEAATAAAFVAFARHPADVTILEVGLGGRLDATNVIPETAASVITRLSFDHREYLGDTLDSIAREKAGILRAGKPCFAAQQPSQQAFETLKLAAAQSGSLLFVGGRDWRVEIEENDHFLFESSKRRLTLPLPALVGRHQVDNAGLALVASSALPFSVSDQAAQKAMAQVEWPARLQKITHGRLADLLPQGWELWLDGGHNDSAGEVLAWHIRQWLKQDKDQSRPLCVILGMISTKRPEEFLAPLVPYIQQLRTVTIDNEPLSLSAEELCLKAKNDGVSKAETSPNLKEAIQGLTKKGPSGRVLICGSLYLAGNALRENESEQSLSLD